MARNKIRNESLLILRELYQEGMTSTTETELIKEAMKRTGIKQKKIKVYRKMNIATKTSN